MKWNSSQAASIHQRSVRLPSAASVAIRTVAGFSRVAPGRSDARVKSRHSTATVQRECPRQRRACVPAMYSQAVVRELSQRRVPLEGHVLDLSETGMAVQLDERIAVGQPVTVEFRVAGLGRMAEDQWPEFAAAAVVVRQDGREDFPAGPYKLALRFSLINTMAQAQIARFVAAQDTSVF